MSGWVAHEHASMAEELLARNDIPLAAKERINKHPPLSPGWRDEYVQEVMAAAERYVLFRNAPSGMIFRERRRGAGV